MALLANRPGAGCGTESHMDYQELLSRGHGQRQPPTLCHHSGEPGQVSGSSVPPPHKSWGGPRASLWATVQVGTESCWPSPASPPPRVKRLGCFDHAQRQLGERCLFVFPAKVELAKIACECPEKHCAQGEGSMAKKVCPRAGLVSIEELALRCFHSPAGRSVLQVVGGSPGDLCRPRRSMSLSLPRPRCLGSACWGVPLRRARRARLATAPPALPRR